MLLVTFATTALAGPALAYKALVLDQPQDEIAPQRPAPPASGQPLFQPR